MKTGKESLVLSQCKIFYHDQWDFTGLVLISSLLVTVVVVRSFNMFMFSCLDVCTQAIYSVSLLNKNNERQFRLKPLPYLTDST